MSQGVDTRLCLPKTAWPPTFGMGKRKANHVIPGANAASAQGQGAGFNEEIAKEPLTVKERMNNKKRKKNQ